MKRLILSLAPFFLSACAMGSAGLGDVERTFHGAYVAFPGEVKARVKTREQMTAGPIGGNKSYPVVLYLHGCTGLGKVERAFGAKLAEEGYVFIAPDSMARRYRPLQCDPKTQTGGFNRFVFDFRMAEVSYALDALAQYSWINRDQLFLMGGSEGGVAAALYRGDEFSGRIIFQWTCHGAPLVRGLGAPEDEPVLAIVNEGDPWYDEKNTANQSGHCGEFLQERKSSTSVLMSLGAVHNVLSEKRTEMLIKNFLDILVD